MPATGLTPEACGRVLRSLPNVAGFGRVRRQVRGRDTGEPCITVLVTRKLPQTVLTTALFAGQILTTPLARPGGSGSLLLDRRNRAVGLIFTGSADAAVANDISAVLRSLALTSRRPA